MKVMGAGTRFYDIRGSLVPATLSVVLKGGWEVDGEEACVDREESGARVGWLRG